jgi:hypothetical protein
MSEYYEIHMGQFEADRVPGAGGIIGTCFMHCVGAQPIAMKVEQL